MHCPKKLLKIQAAKYAKLKYLAGPSTYPYSYCRSRQHEKKRKQTAKILKNKKQNKTKSRTWGAVGWGWGVEGCVAGVGRDESHIISKKAVRIIYMTTASSRSVGLIFLWLCTIWHSIIRYLQNHKSQVLFASSAPLLSAVPK